MTAPVTREYLHPPESPADLDAPPTAAQVGDSRVLPIVWVSNHATPLDGEFRGPDAGRRKVLRRNDRRNPHGRPYAC